VLPETVGDVVGDCFREAVIGCIREHRSSVLARGLRLVVPIPPNLTVETTYHLAAWLMTKGFEIEVDTLSFAACARCFVVRDPKILPFCARR